MSKQYEHRLIFLKGLAQLTIDETSASINPEAPDVIKPLQELIEYINKTIKHDDAEKVEALAKHLYEQMPYDGEGKKPDWIPGGNSIKQDEARTMARKVLF